MSSTSFSRKDPRMKGARSNTAYQRGASVLNSPSVVQLVDQKPEPKQEESQEPSRLRERLIGCVPNNTHTFVFLLFVLAYLACAIIRFAHTNDGGMLVTLLPYAAGYVGIPMVTPHIPWGKKDGDDRKN